MTIYRSTARRKLNHAATLVVLLLAQCLAPRGAAITLRELTAKNPPRLFAATKGAQMPNAIDKSEHLQEGDKALLLSGKGLSDLTGLSQLSVDDGGRLVPVSTVANLHLYLNQNEFTVLPDEIGALTNVVFFYCEHNHLRTLPRALMKMESLIAMYFTANEFTEIPAFVFDMTWLRKLQFSENHLTVLPAEIGKLNQLRHFNIAGNQIAVIPDSIALLTRLRVCDFSDNRIRRLPESFGDVRIENQLRVRNNPLTALPAGFAKMRATIDITGTEIDPTALPPELRAKISTEKPPGSKDNSKSVVKRAVKDK